MDQYQLQASDRDRVPRYARNEVRAALYVDIQEAFQTIRPERSPDQQLLVDVFTRLVRELHGRVLRESLSEHNRWAANPCAYEPPPGFSYDARSACIGASAAFRPESPGLQAFMTYGAKRVYDNATLSDPRTGHIFWATSNAAMLGYGTVATLGAGLLGAAVGVGLPASAVSAIFPFAVREFFNVGEAGIASSSAGSAGSAGATAFGGIAAVLAATVSALVTASMSLARELEVPVVLQTLVDRAGDYDPEWIMQNCNNVVVCMGAGNSNVRTTLDVEIFTILQLITLPDYPGTEPAPAARPEDGRFIVAGSPVEWLRYRSDDKEGSIRAVRLSSSPWFADRPDGAPDNEARLTLSISYRTVLQDTWTARRVGDQFLMVRTGVSPTSVEYPGPQQSAELVVGDPRPGLLVTASVGR
jgi:hypothetical protein